MKEYFAGGNTADGFINYLTYAAAGRKKIWILRGCPGCGKSRFMRTVADIAAKKHIDCDLIRCSSDLESLDGVVIPTLDFAVFDGTAPHTLYAGYPLAAEREIDFAAFAAEPSENAKKEIRELTDRKRMLYKRGYMLLKAAELQKEALYEQASQYILADKLERFVSRRLKTAPQNGKADIMQVTSFGAHGLIRLGDDHAKNICRINDIGYGVREKMFEMIYQKTNGKKRILSFDALSAKRYTDIYLPDLDILFTCSDVANAKNVDAKRFVSQEGRRKLNKDIKRVRSKCAELYSEAQSIFAAAALMHREIESYYTPLIDFEKCGEYQDRLISSLFDRT